MTLEQDAGAPGLATKHENDLLDRWAARLGGRFFRDGAVDPATYWHENRRVVFVLKEVNVTPDEADWDLRIVVQEVKRSQTWAMLANWAHGLLGGMPDWRSLRRISPEERVQLFRRVAIVNLNKRGGGSRSTVAAIRKATVESRSDLRAHLELLQPHVIVCGGTGEWVRRHVMEDPASWQEPHPDGWALPAAGARSPLIGTRHPQARISHERLYEGVMAAARHLGLT